MQKNLEIIKNAWKAERIYLLPRLGPGSGDGGWSRKCGGMFAPPDL